MMAQPKLPADFESVLLSWLRENNQADDPETVNFDQNTNLMDTAILDSVGLLDLVAFAETETGVILDLAELSHDEFAAVQSVSGLCSIVASRIGT